MSEQEPTIRKMPDQRTLEAFVKGLTGNVRVTFNPQKGEFEWVSPEEKLNEAKTELGEQLKKL